jgi:hypothetical protein
MVSKPSNRRASRNAGGKAAGEQQEPRTNLHDEVTARIVAELEAGCIPWVQPWSGAACVGPSLPRNALTGRSYSGVNVLLLWGAVIANGYRREAIDRATVKHLTMASKAQQKAWLALLDDPNAYVPTGHQLKAWLLGGQSISAAHALFDVEAFKGALVADLFGDDRYFADADAFWTAQNAVIDERCEA